MLRLGCSHTASICYVLTESHKHDMYRDPCVPSSAEIGAFLGIDPRSAPFGPSRISAEIQGVLVRMH